MKNVTYTTSGVTVFIFKYQYLWPSNSLVRRYNQGVLAIRRIFSLVDMIAKPKF